MSNNKKVTIMDYGIGNLLSVKRAIEECGANATISEDKGDIIKSDYLILPGVGNFAVAIEELRKRGFEEIILKFYETGKPLLGICLGMQMLFDNSEEQGLHKGLGIISGSVKAIPKINPRGLMNKIPHIGWSSLIINENYQSHNLKILNNNDQGKTYYFIHSFQGHTNDVNNCVAVTKYNEMDITAVVQKNAVIGCQFHPEKSGVNGIELLKKFLNC